MLSFIDGKVDTFHNIYNKLALFGEHFPYSKCYLVNQGGTLIPYQLIYENQNVYQYAANNYNIKRIVIPPPPKPSPPMAGWAANTHGLYPGYHGYGYNRKY